MSLFSGHYIDWRKSRLSGIKKYINLDILKNRTLLELGAGYGDNGNEFYNLGCKVTSSDARVKHINSGKIMFPHIDFEIIDCDKSEISKNYDIILHWGLLYHLREIDDHLKNVCENCNILLLDTEVSDSDDDSYCIRIDENKNVLDQAYNGKGIRPSQKYVEKVLRNNGFKYFVINDKILNSFVFKYDWKNKNKNNWNLGMRRFLICWNENVDEKQLFKNLEM